MSRLTPRYVWFVARVTALGATLGMHEPGQQSLPIGLAVLEWMIWGTAVALVFCEIWQYLRPEALR